MSIADADPGPERPPLEDPGSTEEEEAEAPRAPTPPAAQAPSAPAAPPEAATPIQQPEPASPQAPEATAPSEATAPPAAAPEPAEPPRAGSAADLDLADLIRAWPAVLDKVSEKSPALAATFEGARPVRCGEDGIEIGFPPDAAFNKRKAESPDRREAVAAAFGVVIGRELRPHYVTLEKDDEAPPDTPAPGSEEIDEDAVLKKVMSEFDAEEIG
jgi:hypothetical protein